jgi:hypothetical protein
MRTASCQKPSSSMASRIVYVIVALSAIWQIGALARIASSDREVSRLTRANADGFPKRSSHPALHCPPIHEQFEWLAWPLLLIIRILFLFSRNHATESPVPSRARGERVVTYVGRDAMDADALAGRAARSADGEGVWSWHPWAGAKCRG